MLYPAEFFRAEEPGGTDPGYGLSPQDELSWSWRGMENIWRTARRWQKA